MARYDSQLNCNFPTVGASRVRQVVDGPSGLPESIPGVTTGEAVSEGHAGEALGNVAEGVGEAVSGVASLATSAAGDGDETKTESEKESAAVSEKNHQKLTNFESKAGDSKPLRQDPYKIADAGMSWGRGGETITTSERSAPTNPPEAMAAAGIAPGDVTQTEPMPEILPGPSGSRLEPDRDNSEGLWNASDIFNNTRIGG